MMQGDAYHLSFKIKKGDDVITDEMVDDVEIVIGKIRKSLSAGEVSWGDGVWLFPLTQDETFDLRGIAQRAQVRVKFKGGDIIGVRLPDIDVDASLSSEVL